MYIPFMGYSDASYCQTRSFRFHTTPVMCREMCLATGNA